MPPKLGILAGSGDLPARLIAACQAAGREILVVAFEGETDSAAVSAVPHAWSRLAAVGRTLELLGQGGCEEVVMAGGMRRPKLSALKPDKRGAELLGKLVKGGLSDEKVLAAIIAELEAEGFRVVGAEQVLGGLLAPEGPIGKLAPEAGDWSDIDRGIRVLRALGAVDVGQAAVVRQGVVLGVEAQEGTDALIERCATLAPGERGGVLVKLAKPGQDRRVDLPAIGVATVKNAVAAGLRGIAVEAGGSLVIDRDEVAGAADEAGLFVIGVSAERGPE